GTAADFSHVRYPGSKTGVLRVLEFEFGIEVADVRGLLNRHPKFHRVGYVQGTGGRILRSQSRARGFIIVVAVPAPVLGTGRKRIKIQKARAQNEAAACGFSC